MRASHKQSKLDAIQEAEKFLDSHPIYLDTETTGTGLQDEIVEIAVIDHDGIILLDKLIKPKIKIPKEASQIHQITNELVRNAPTWADIWPDLKSVLSNREVAIYNAEFDLRLMRQSSLKYGLSWSSRFASEFCIMKLYARFYGEWSDYHQNYTWQSLEKAARQSRIRLPNTHRAKDDALLSRAVLHHIAGKDWSIQTTIKKSAIEVSTAKSPEELELEAKRARLQELEEILANKELELVTLQTELISFQDVYLRIVGVKIAQLDELEAKIAEFLAKKFPAQKSYRTAAKEARKKAKSSSHAHEYEEREKPKEKFSPTEELKTIYRNLAKQIHPDLAVDHKDRQLREEFMKMANEAYQKGDANRLKELENEWQASPSHIKGEGIAEELVRLIRFIAAVEKRIEKIDAEIESMTKSQYFELKSEYEKAKKEGRDLLEEMKAYLEKQIKIKEAEFIELAKAQ